MSDNQVHIYLEEPLRKSALAGEHNFINLVCKTLISDELEPVFPEKVIQSSKHSLSHMAQPPTAKGLVFRRVYQYPFWQIDAVAQRWLWDIARAKFDPTAVPDDASRFFQFWRRRLFGQTAATPAHDGFVYVPLQGKLDQHRSFQSCTPLEMIEHCLQHDPRRQIIAALHPKETYSPRELSKLEALGKRHERLTIDIGKMDHYLQGCDYVVTQNSSAAFFGFFFQKPALLFGKIDFHHIAVCADMAALQDSFAEVEVLTPDYAKYIWWFWQDQSINAGREDAESKIATRLRRYGWPV